jgi:hypothetical protein
VYDVEFIIVAAGPTLDRCGGLIDRVAFVQALLDGRAGHHELRAADLRIMNIDNPRRVFSWRESSGVPI